MMILCRFFTFCVVCILAPLQGHCNPAMIPGRIDNGQLHYTQIGGNYILFYMTPEKERLSKQFVSDFTDTVMLAMELKEPLSAYRVVPLCDKIPFYRNQYSLSEPNSTGETLIKEYGSKIQAHIEQMLSLKIKNPDFKIRLNTNQDHPKMDKTICFSEESLQLKEPVLIEDITTFDWQMAESTLAATMFEENDSHDRFLFNIFPGELVSTFYAQPFNRRAKCGIVSSYLEIAPIEFDGKRTAGSWKGKTMRAITRGLIANSDLVATCKKGKFLDPNLPSIQFVDYQESGRVYPNGMLLKRLNDIGYSQKSKRVNRLVDQENLSILEEFKEEKLGLINSLIHIFSLKNHKISGIFRLIKRDGGFSRFSQIGLPIKPTSEIIILNHSHLPEGYKSYPISDDVISTGKPWIQMYHFPNQMGMKISGTIWNQLALTPVEEILHRKEFSTLFDQNIVGKNLSEIEIFIFN